MIPHAIDAPPIPFFRRERFYAQLSVLLRHDSAKPRNHEIAERGMVVVLAALFVAVDEAGRAYVYDEIYESGLIVSEAAERIREKKTDNMIFIAPADLWSRQKDSGKSIADLFAQGGIYLTKLSPCRTAGWLALKEWLKAPEGIPNMVIDKKCKNIIRCLPLLMHDKTVPDDAATQPHEITHAPDALRYFASFLVCPAAGDGERTFRRRVKR